MVGRAIKTTIVDVGSLSDAVVFTSTMAIRCMNRTPPVLKLAAFGIGGCCVQKGGASMLCGMLDMDHVVCRAAHLLAKGFTFKQIGDPPPQAFRLAL